MLLCSMSIPHYVFPLLLYVSCYAGHAQAHELSFSELEIQLRAVCVPRCWVRLDSLLWEAELNSLEAYYEPRGKKKKRC